MSREQFNGRIVWWRPKLARLTTETEVNGRLTCGAPLGLELDTPIVPGDPGVVTPDPGQQRRLGPLSGTKPLQSLLETPGLTEPRG